MFWLFVVYALGVFWYHKTIREGDGWDRGYTPNRRMMGKLALSWPVIVVCRFAIDIALAIVYVITWAVGLFIVIGLVFTSLGLIALDVWGPDIDGPALGPEDLNRGSVGDNAPLRWCHEKRLSSVVMFKKNMQVWEGYQELLKTALLLECGAVMIGLILLLDVLENM